MTISALVSSPKDVRLYRDGITNGENTQRVVKFEATALNLARDELRWSSSANSDIRSRLLWTVSRQDALNTFSAQYGRLSKKWNAIIDSKKDKRQRKYYNLPVTTLTWRLHLAVRRSRGMTTSKMRPTRNLYLPPGHIQTQTIFRWVEPKAMIMLGRDPSILGVAQTQTI